jgi:hypothetical protein
MLIISAIQLTAHASLLSSSLLMHLPLLKAFTCFSCTCSTSRSLLPDAIFDILHNSQGLLFHPRAVTPLGSSPRTRFCCRCVRALRVLSLMCMCSCFHMGDQVHCTHEVSHKSVYHPSLATRGQFGSGFDRIMITTAKSSRLLLLHATTLQSATVLCRPTSGHLLHLWPRATSFNSLLCLPSLT